MERIMKKLNVEELHLMTVFWNKGVPMTVRQATKAMNGYFGVFYTEQMTAILIERMMKKGYLEKRKCGKAFYFFSHLSKCADLFPFYYREEERISDEKRERIKKLIDELED